MNDYDYQEEVTLDLGDSARMRWLIPVGRSIFGVALGLLFSIFLVLALFGVLALPTIS